MADELEDCDELDDSDSDDSNESSEVYDNMGVSYIKFCFEL